MQLTVPQFHIQLKFGQSAHLTDFEKAGVGFQAETPCCCHTGGAERCFTATGGKSRITKNTVLEKAAAEQKGSATRGEEFWLGFGINTRPAFSRNKSHFLLEAVGSQ